MKALRDLVLGYYAACVAARERLLCCSSMDPDKVDEGGCYREWRNNRKSSFPADSLLGRPTDEEMANWCPECRANEGIVHRTREAAKRRGAYLRLLQRWAANQDAAEQARMG